MNKNEPIEEGLFEVFNNASIDAEGIDWNSFAQKRSRKKRLFIFWMLFAGLLGFGALTFTFLNSANQNISDNNSPKLYKPEVIKPYTGPNTIETERKKGLNADRESVNLNPVIKKSAFGRGLYPDTKGIRVKIENQVYSEMSDASKEMANRAMENNPFDEINWFGPKLNVTQNIYFFENEKPLRLLEMSKHLNKVEPGSVYLQFQAGPSYNFPHFEVSETGKSFIHKNYQEIRRNSEVGRAGYGFLIMAGKSLNKMDFGFGTGLSSISIFGNYDFYYSEKPIINPDGSIAGYNLTTPSTIRFNSKLNYTFVEFPVFIDYHLIKRNKILTSLHLGIVNQFLKNINGEMPNALFLDHKDKLSSENFRTHTGNMEIGLRMTYKLSTRMNFVINPVYRKNLGFYQIQSYYRSNFSNFGLQFGIQSYL